MGDATAEAASPDAGSGADAAHDSSSGGDSSMPHDGAVTCGTCPTGTSCKSANGIPVCRAPSGIPLFSNVFVILMENTSLSTLQAAMTAGSAPNLSTMTAEYATGSDYHGVSHPSLPNYIALSSGGTQGISCDCGAAPGKGTCNTLTCLTGCTCTTAAKNLADQLETAGKTWMDYGESMGSPCNLTDNGNYAVRHNPFLYYTDIQNDSARCSAHVVDFTGFDPSKPSVFTFIAPNLVDDMHNPDPTTSVNIPDGDKWIGPQVTRIVSSAAYKQGGLLVVVWDEDDNSTGDSPIPVFVMSPYAKHGGYVSATMADHYALLATIEDGLGLPRLGSAATATPLSDYFPAQ